MNKKNFSEILSFIEQEILKIRIRNLKSERMEFPRYEPGISPSGSVTENVRVRQTAQFRTYLSQQPVFMDIENYTEGESGYLFWSYIPKHIPGKDSAYLFSFDKNRHLPHRHEFAELIFVYQGVYTVMIEGVRQCFHENEICILNSSCEHEELETECRGIYIYLGFQTSVLTELWNRHLINGSVRSFLFDKSREKDLPRYLRLNLPQKHRETANLYFTYLFEELYHHEIGSDHVSLILLLRLLNLFERYGNEKSETISPRDDSAVLFQKITTYIDEHLASVNLKELNETFHYQEDYYNRLFKKITNSSFREYLHRKKMEQAKFLLKETQLTVQEIMENLGYHSRPHFFHIFQSETGMTPMEFRKTIS